MDTKVKNMFGTKTTEDRAEQLAPRPVKKSSRSAHLYDIMSSLGGSASLTAIWRMVPASDLKTRPKNRQQLRDWISQSATSKGYFVRVSKDNYRLATSEEHRAIVERNADTARKYKVKKDRQQARTAAIAEQPNTSSQFAREYLGALLGTSCAIVLFYVILKLTV
tara:strand:- start:1091 stop:1585 length:495 start_codon:yes stop_codon:yes gene_type:complete